MYGHTPTVPAAPAVFMYPNQFTFSVSTNLVQKQGAVQQSQFKPEPQALGPETSSIIPWTLNPKNPQTQSTLKKTNGRSCLQKVSDHDDMKWDKYIYYLESQSSCENIRVLTSAHMQKKREGHRKKYQGEAAPLKETLNHSYPTVVGATSHKQITTINCTGQCTTSRT